MNQENRNGTGGHRRGTAGEPLNGHRPFGTPPQRPQRGTRQEDSPTGCGIDAGGPVPAGGMTLADWRDGRMTTGVILPREAFAVCRRLAKFLDRRARDRGTWPVLCPECVDVEVDGSDVSRVKVVGIREASDAEAMPYCAPEIRNGAPETAASCRFSLACILYELLVGHVPEGPSAPAPGVLRPAQGRALMRALSPEPSRRTGSCSQMIAAVAAGRDGRGWIPLVAVACSIAAVAVCWLAWEGIRDAQRKKREEATKEFAVTAGTDEGGGTVGDESQISILERAAKGGDAGAMVELSERYRTGNGVDSDAAVAFQWLEKAAEAGEPDAMVAVGKAYAQGGDGVAADPAKAAEWFRKAAEEGHSEGRAVYAECLWEGRGVPQNREEAAHWALLAADAEIPSAQFIAGMCLVEGIGTPKDEQGGVRLVKRAADTGLSEARLGMARFYASGIGVAKNGPMAIQWARQAAGDGLPEAQTLLGSLLYAGTGGTPDKTEALKWYLEASWKGNADAQAHAGAMLVTGDGVPRDVSRGVSLLRQAAEQDYPMAFSALAKCHSEGWGVPKDVRKAAELLRQGAELGDSDAMGEYGAALVLGNMVAKKPAEGLRWLERAAATGNPVQQFALAQVLIYGLAGRADAAKGLEWMERAAAAGLPEAQSQLAILLQQGKITAADPERSFDLHLAAAKAGVLLSQSQIGTYYYNGYGCDRDYEEAFRWYKKAAEGGDDDAMVGVANCYDKGRGTSVDRKEALAWYKKASGSSNGQIAEVAKRAVARLSADGAGDAADAVEAVRIFRERAESGDVVAMYDFAQRLDEGKGIPKDSAEAAKWWRKLAEIPELRKDVGALQIGAWVQYGIHLLDGDGVARNPAEAAKWMEKAASDWDERTEMGLGDANLKLKALACRRLAECYDKGIGVPQDARKAFGWYQAGALNGDIECNLETGDRFADGRAGHRDPFGPQRWYERAANRGSAEGAYRAGLSYARQGAIFRSKAEEWLKKAVEMGHPKADAALRDLRSGTLQTALAPKTSAPGTVSAAEAHNKGYAAAQRGAMTEAVKWYRQAAEQGFGPSCVNLGLAYYHGQGVARDYSEAVKWFRRGTDAGHVEAQYNLATCLLNGRGARKDAAEAVRLFRLAAAKGHAKAQHSLGACLYNGDGVPQNRTEAVQWFRKAAAQGNADAKDALRQLGLR